MSYVPIFNDMIEMTIPHYYLICRLLILKWCVFKLNLSIVLDYILKECRKWLFQSSSLIFLLFSIFITADFKPEQIQIVSFVTMTSDRNDSVKVLNHWDSFLPDISASILKSNHAKLLARSIS